MPGLLDLCGFLEAQGLTRYHTGLCLQSLIALQNSALNQSEAQPVLLVTMLEADVDVCILEPLLVCRGLVTRNVDASVAYFHKNHFNTLSPFWPALSRDFKPYKPNPGALLHICQHWNISPEQAIMIGDSARDDVSHIAACFAVALTRSWRDMTLLGTLQVVAGNRAGMDTILLDTMQRYTDKSDLEGETKPTHTVTSLAAIPEILESFYCLERPSHLAKATDVPPKTKAMVG